MSAISALLGSPVELTDFSSHGRDIESQQPPPPKPRASFCGSIVRDYMEIAPCAQSASAVALVIIFGLFGLGCYYIDNADYWRWGGVAAGALGVASFTVVALVSCCSCLTIRHLKPEKDLEGQINQLGKKVNDYAVQIRALQQVNAHLRQLSDDFKAVAAHQIELKQQTEQMLATKVAELQGVNDSLAQTQRALEDTRHLLDDFHRQVEEANRINDQISKTLLEAQKHVPEISAVSDGGHDHDGAVVVNIGELSRANVSFNEHNTNLNQLTDELRKQLAFMEKFQGILAQHAEVFRAGALSLDETDDKLLQAAQALGSTAEQRFKLMRQMSEKLKKTQEVLKSLKQVIEHIEDPTIRQHFSSIVPMIDSLG